MSRRLTQLPREGRPEHALSDCYPLVVNMKKAPYACIECVEPCGRNDFLYGQPDCERRHSGKEMT